MPIESPSACPESSRSSAPPGTAAGLGVEVRRARLSFDGVALFAGLDLVLAPGRVTCLLGPSGVGKSTLLRLIAGLLPVEPPTRIVAGDGAPLAGRIAYMDQRDLLLPWLDVLGNVTLGARLRRERPDRARALALLDAVGLADRAGAAPHVLSGGMRQRVALARTLMEDRPVVLMDEPFSALDALTRLRLQDLATGLLAGRTVLLVTHDPIEALRMAHRVEVMAPAPPGAGATAALVDSFAVPGAPPRDPTAPEVVVLQRRLLAALGVGSPAAARASGAP